MKTTLYTFAILTISFVSFAGPADKNYKPWKHQKNFSEVVATEVSDINGPQAKNQKAWETNNAQVAIETGNRVDLKGPQAKNYKSFRK